MPAQSLDLALRDTDDSVVGIVNPQSGEALSLEDATREDIATWFVWITEQQSLLQRAVREAERAFAEKSDKETDLGVRVGSYRVSVPGAAERFVPNAETLRAALLSLVEEGSITQRAADDACEPNGVACPHCQGFVPTGGFKIRARALNALRKVKRNETIIDACGEYHPPARTFKVEKK